MSPINPINPINPISPINPKPIQRPSVLPPPASESCNCYWHAV